MIWKTEQRQQPTQATIQSPSGAAGEKFELLKLRDSKNETARAVALGFLLMLRKLEEITAAQGVEP